MHEENLAVLAKNLEKRHFHTRVFDTADEASAAVLELIGGGHRVGIGGSMTVHDMRLHEKLHRKGNIVLWHWLAPANDRVQVRDNAIAAEYYLCSANAITMEGCIFNIDGVGNRVLATFFGDAHVIMIVGANKVVRDDASAIARIKTVACPANARRLNLSTPCALTGVCTDCSSPQRMCNITVKLEHAPLDKRIDVFLVNEPLGF